MKERKVGVPSQALCHDANGGRARVLLCYVCVRRGRQVAVVSAVREAPLQRHVLGVVFLPQSLRQGADWGPFCSPPPSH